MKQTIIKNVLIEKQDVHLSFSNPVAVFLDRRTKSKQFLLNPLEQIGQAILDKRHDGIYATLKINATGNAVKGLYPNVGYIPKRVENGQVTIGEIITVNISRFTNKDKSIPSIKLN